MTEFPTPPDDEDGGDADAGRILAPEELDIADDEHVTQIDDGRFVVSPSERPADDPVGVDAHATPEPVTSVTGTHDGSTVSALDLNVKKAPGAGDIDLTQATIQWVGPQGTGDSQISSGDVTAVQSDENPVYVLTTESDMVTVSYSLPNGAISTGTTGTLELTTASGGTTTVTINVPDSLDSSNTKVSL